MKEADIKKQLEELRKRQEAAMRQMQQAAADLELRKVGDTASLMRGVQSRLRVLPLRLCVCQAEVSKAKAELSSTIAERDRVGAEADLVSVHQPCAFTWVAAAARWEQRGIALWAARYEQRVMSGASGAAAAVLGWEVTRR